MFERRIIVRKRFFYIICLQIVIRTLMAMCHELEFKNDK
jgi:hypothetical protein